MTLNVVSWLMVAALATPAAASKTPATALKAPASVPVSTATPAKSATAPTVPVPVLDPTLDDIAPDASCPEAEVGDSTAEDADAAENDGHEDPALAAGAIVDTGEGDVVDPNAPLSDEPRYTTDVSDIDLKANWEKDPALLGPVSIGFTNAGRLINGVPFPTGGNWLVVQPEGSFGTQETIDFILAAMGEVETRFPDTPPLRINHIAKKEGGYLRPHRSHQSGRDVDLGFYYPTADPVRVRAREQHIDVARNWALVRALIVNTDVQFILVDKHVQKVLRAHAESVGENRAWVDSLFSGPEPLIRHARGHRDHFHVRFFNARAQELGRRVQPLLSLVPEMNLTTHRVRRGDTLGHIARRYGTSVNGLKKANGLKNNNLRVGRTLTIPLKGPCTKCPVPPPFVVPPRRLPPVEVISLLVDKAPVHLKHED